jgi:hypothetical protein
MSLSQFVAECLFADTCAASGTYPTQQPRLPNRKSQKGVPRCRSMRGGGLCPRSMHHHEGIGAQNWPNRVTVDETPVQGDSMTNTGFEFDVARSVQIAVQHYWGHSRMTEELCQATAIYGPTRHAPMTFEEAHIVPASPTPRVSLTEIGVARAETLLGLKRAGVWLDPSDLVVLAVWCLGAFEGSSRSMRARRRLSGGVLPEGVFAPARRCAAIDDVAGVLDVISDARGPLGQDLIEEWLSCGHYVRWHRPVDERVLVPEFRVQPMRARSWVWLRRQPVRREMPEAVALQADWLLRRLKSGATSGTALSDAMLLRQRQSLEMVQAAISSLIKADPTAVWATATQTAIPHLDVYSPGQRFAGQLTTLRSRARLQTSLKAIRTTFRVPDGAVWRPGDRPGCPSLLIEHEADRGPVATRHVLDALGFSSLWGYPQMTLCVIVGSRTRRQVVDSIERLPTTVEYQATRLEFPTARLLVRVVDQRHARRDSILTCPSRLEIRL